MFLLIWLWILLGFIAVIFTPMVMGWAVGLIWGGLTKLGVVGKIVNTLLMVVIGAMLGLIPLAIAQVFKVAGSTLATSLIIVSAIIIPVWYFFWHHDVVKAMGIVAFSISVKLTFMIVWYGGILGMVVAMFSQQTGIYIATGSLLAGVGFYAMTTRGAAEDVDRDDSPSFRFRWIGLAAAVCLLVPLNIWNINYQKEETARREANKAANEAGVVTAKGAKNKKQEAVAAKYVAGTVLLLGGNQTIKLYEEANESSKVLKEFHNKGGEKLIANGEVLFDPDENWLAFVSVDYKGTKGWIDERSLSTVIGIATVVADKVEFTPRYTYDANGKATEPPTIILKKGDTFEVLSVRKDRKDKKYTYTDGIYKGTLGFIVSRGEVITITNK